MKERRKADRQRRIHSFTILSFLYRYAFLLLIPLIQYLIFKPRSLWDMIKSGSADILYASAIIFYIVLKYRTTYLYREGGEIVYSRGIWLLRRGRIPERSLNGAAESGGIMSIFGASKISLNAAGQRMAAQEYIASDCTAASTLRIEGGFVKRFGILHTITAAADSTSALSGLLIAVPFIRRAAAIIGDGLKRQLYGGIDIWSNAVSRLLPPAVAYTSGIAAAGYIIALIYQLMRHAGGEITLSDKIIQIKRGFIRTYRLSQRSSEISALTEEQGLICTVFKIKKAFMLTDTGQRLKAGRELLAVSRGALKRPKACAKPHVGSLFSFILLPCALLMLSVGAAFYLAFKRIYIPLDIIQCTAIPFCLFFIMFRMLAFERTFLSVDEEKIFCGTHRGFRVINSKIPLLSITSAEISQNPIQRLTGSCNVKIKIKNRSGLLKIKRLKLSDVLKLKSEAEENKDE